MDVKSEVLLQLFNKSKLRNGTKRFWSQIFSLFIFKFNKSGFIAPLSVQAKSLAKWLKYMLVHSNYISF